MGLLGKKYPMSEDEFKKLKLKGKFQPENAGKRMRLQIPFTWETQVSLHGNKPQVWHDLILSKKLPYLSIIRNLRNMVLSGINENQLKDIIYSVKNLSAIGSSKVFLHQYLYAYNALDEIGGRSERKLRIMRRRKKEKNSIKEIWSQTDLDFSSELKNVLQETIQSSILRNLSPIEGHSLIFLVNYESIDHVWKDYGLIGFNAICLFTGLVIAQACKSYKLLSCGENGVEEHGRRKLTKEFFSMFIHDYCQHLWEKFGSLEMVRNYLYSIKDKQKIDNLILIFRNPPKKDTLDKFIKFIDYYRRISVNSSTMNLALLTIDGSLPYLFPLESNSRNVCISGFGDAALKTLSKLSSGQSQLEEVESIDSKYKIYNKKPLITPIARPKSQIIWTRVKIFVSSTFLDMFGERNLLNYCVFPELRRRCRNINVEITPLDLRWGIPEDHSLETCMTRYCLERVQESDIFICFLGERYGWKPRYSLPIEKQFLSGNEAVIEKFKENSISITELEIRLRGWQRAHFYFRDPLTLSLIKCENDISQFRESVNSEESGALNQLKEDIRNSGCPLYENYRASSLSKSNSNPVFSHFDEDFVRTVIDRLWKDILDIVSKKLVTRIDFMSSFISKETKEFIGRTKELEKMTEIILSHKNEFKCIEVQGTGKTAFLCKLATILSNTSDVIVIPFFSDGVMDSFCIMEYLEHQILQLHSKINIDDYTQSSKDDSYLSCIRVAKLISQIQTCGKLVCIIVDEPPKDNVSWIPYCKFPPGVRIIVSSNTSDYLMKKHLSSRRKKYHLDAFVSLDGIKDMKIKKELVVNFLKKMGDKVLTEAPLNNVLRLVASKKESGNIKYLKTLCSVLVSSDAIVNGNEKKMIKEHLPGNLQDLYHFILERDDEDSHILEPILNILNECEGPSFNQLMRATQNILGKTVSSISLLRSLNRLEIFMEPSLKKGFFLKDSFKNGFLKNYIKEDKYRSLLFKYYLMEFEEDVKNSDYIHPYLLNSLLQLCISMGNNSFLRDLSFIYYWAKNGVDSMEYFYHQCVISKIADKQLLNFLQTYSESLVNNPMLTYQYGINSSLVDGLGHTCFLEMNHDRVKDNSTFLMLEILNKDISMKLPDIERMTSFSKLAILCAATYEDIWIYGTDDCVIVEQKAKTMFGLYVHSPVTSLSFVQGSEVISVGLQDGTVSFWDINKRINVSNHPQIHFKPVSSIFLMPLSRSIVSTGLDGNFFVFSSTLGKFKMTGKFSHSLPISCGTPVNESSILVGTWGGELLRVNIIDNEVSQKGLCCKGAICDIVVKLNVNDEILVSCSDTEGYVYIADIKLTLKKCWKLGSPSLTLTGNKLSFLSESEILIGCSDGCIRCFEFKSFNSNFYYYFNHVVNHRYHSLSGKYKIPTFEGDVVICMDSYEGRKVLGYNSGWIRFINKAQVSFCIKLINKEGELCQALMFQENIFILTTNKNRLVSFRFNEELREIYDLREITHVTSDFEYLNFIVPISRAKGIFIYPREDATFEIYQIPEETHNRIRKRPKIDSDIKTYTPILTSEKYFDPDNDFSSPVTFIDYNNGYIFMGSRIILALWKYSSDTNSLEKISEELCSHKINELILKSLPNKGDTFRCYGSYDETGLVTFDLRLNSKGVKEMNNLVMDYKINGADKENLIFYKKGDFHKYLSKEEFFQIMLDSNLNIQYHRNSRIVRNNYHDEEYFILSNEIIDHMVVKAHDMPYKPDILSYGFKSINYIDESLNFCTPDSRLQLRIKKEKKIEEKNQISSILNIPGGDDRNWIILSAPHVYLYALSDNEAVQKNKFDIQNEMEFEINSVWRDNDDSIILSCFSKVELFSVILYSNGSQERKRIWFNDSKLLSAKPLSEDINSECDDKCEGEKTQDNDETMSNSSRSEDDENSSSSSSDNGLSYNYYGKLKSARNSLIGIDWNSGYKHGIVTLGFEDGSNMKVNINETNELDSYPYLREMDSIEHFFHVNMSNFKVNLRDVASHVQMSESVDIFGSFDGYLLIQSGSNIYTHLSHKDTVTSVIKIDEFTFVSISLDKYCKIWKLKESDKIEQIGEFLSQVPLYKGGFSRYTKCIILGGAFGVLYFLKMKYYGFSL
uniref:TROVE domain-containing protein n=1 Tax=Lepeophtheirus salmonis TaxID=72036 RepID=A0A0K2TDM8_LEPSM